jgi:hypothetical protein
MGKRLSLILLLAVPAAGAGVSALGSEGEDVRLRGPIG